MEGEMMNFLKVLIIIFASLTYCYYIASRIPKGIIRLLTILPIIVIFLLLPLLLSSLAFQFYIGLCIAWLANFKLLLLAFGYDDPHSGDSPLSLLSFLIVTSLPIKMKEIPAYPEKQKENLSFEVPSNNLNSPQYFVVNLILWSFAFQLYQAKYDFLVRLPILQQFLYSSRSIINVQIIFTLIALMARPFLERDLTPQFVNPHLSTSVQNYWGKRWNLMSSSLLKSVIYTPTRNFLTPIIGRSQAVYPAVLATFATSGLMHELFYFYVIQKWPTWEAMWYFIIHGVFVAIEIKVKKKASECGWSLHPKISTPLTLGFFIVTNTWLSCTELLRSGADQREAEEYAATADYMKSALRAFLKI